MNINDNKLNELINKTERNIQRKSRQRKLIISTSLGAFSIALAIVAISVIMNRQQVPDVVINSPTNNNAATENATTPTSMIDSSTLTPNAEPTPEPISNENNFKYIDELKINSIFPTCYFGNWSNNGTAQPFTMGGNDYNHGIGMFIPTKDIIGIRGSKSLSWNLNGEFDSLAFDLGCEQSFGYDVEAKFGSYIITIYADDNLIFETEKLDYEDVFTNLEIPLGDNCERLEIRFTQYKGELGTLSVVMGDFKLFFK